MKRFVLLDTVSNAVLADMVENSETIQQILEKIGYPTFSGHMYKPLADRIKEIGVDISHMHWSKYLHDAQCEDGYKVCRQCKKTKPINNFFADAKSNDGVSPRCKECTAKYLNKFYRKDIERRREKSRNVAFNRGIDSAFFVYDYLIRSGGCPCGETRIECLMFHHKNEEQKEFNISESLSGNLTNAEILNEIRKCVVVCSNCHADIHGSRLRELILINRAVAVLAYGRQPVENIEYIDSVLRSSGCVICGDRNVRHLCFHHKDKETKMFNIAGGSYSNRSIITLQNEVQKCEVMCENCHRVKHFGNGKYLVLYKERMGL